MWLVEGHLAEGCVPLDLGQTLSGVRFVHAGSVLSKCSKTEERDLLSDEIEKYILLPVPVLRYLEKCWLPGVSEAHPAPSLAQRGANTRGS